LFVYVRARWLYASVLAVVEGAGLKLWRLPPGLLVFLVSQFLNHATN
jgi:hypothetical protein